ncbi:uncharacterized protein LOC119403501 [Rhipicephalus sanguineus]|uniref:uncharacterized protein LOC119403501 n=1 Tax=Rhipicephalus sanguineus TaxID=34632 RepID=UPI0018943814|nr:uncharacterized protein LOC119403501 [Rhipicephalus sanguineus]
MTVRFVQFPGDEMWDAVSIGYIPTLYAPAPRHCTTEEPSPDPVAATAATDEQVTVPPLSSVINSVGAKGATDLKGVIQGDQTFTFDMIAATRDSQTVSYSFAGADEVAESKASCVARLYDAVARCLALPRKVTKVYSAGVDARDSAPKGPAPQITPSAYPEKRRFTCEELFLEVTSLASLQFAQAQGKQLPSPPSRRPPATAYGHRPTDYLNRYAETIALLDGSATEQKVPQAQDQGDREVFAEAKPAEAKYSVKLNEGKVHPNGNSEESVGDVENDEVNAPGVSMTAQAKERSREAEANPRVHAIDNHHIDADTDNDHQAAAANTTEDPPDGGKAEPMKVATPKTKPACRAAMTTQLRRPWPPGRKTGARRNIKASGSEADTVDQGDALVRPTSVVRSTSAALDEKNVAVVEGDEARAPTPLPSHGDRDREGHGAAVSASFSTDSFAECPAAVVDTTREVYFSLQMSDFVSEPTTGPSLTKTKTVCEPQQPTSRPPSCPALECQEASGDVSRVSTSAPSQPASDETLTTTPGWAHSQEQHHCRPSPQSLAECADARPHPSTDSLKQAEVLIPAGFVDAKDLPVQDMSQANDTASGQYGSNVCDPLADVGQFLTHDGLDEGDGGVMVVGVEGWVTVDSQMSEADKVAHVIKGIADDAFHLLVFKNSSTVQDIISECRRFEEAKSRRVLHQFTRLPNTAATSTCEDPRLPSTESSSDVVRIVRREIEAAAPLTSPTLNSDNHHATVSLIQSVVRQELANVG